MYTLILVAVIIWAIWRWKKPDRLAHIPSPPGIPILGNMLQISATQPRLTFQEWAQRYGDVYRLSTISAGEMVVVSGLEPIHEVLVTNGSAFTDRPDNFRVKYIMKNNLFSFRNNDTTCRVLRKTSHRYLKQFGDGMSRLEDSLQHAVGVMISDFEDTKCSPINVMATMKKTTFCNLAVLLMGNPVDQHSELVKMLMKYESEFTKCMNPVRADMMMLDLMPWLIHLPLACSREVKDFVKLQADTWEKIKANQRELQGDSFTKLLLDQVVSDEDAASGRKDGITDMQAGLTCLLLIFGGMLTTSITMYNMVNMLAFRKDIQDKVREEVLNVLRVRGSPQVSLKDKSMLPYLRATILETLRHFPTTPLGALLHQAVEDTKLTGYGVIHKGTRIMINTWTLHHDKSFWGDPEKFRPERFLDDNGELLPPDHPERKHWVPFGAGPRVCVGEIFAMARLFLWTSALVDRFTITPASGSDPSWMDASRHHDDSMVFCPLPNDVIFTPRVNQE